MTTEIAGNVIRDQDYAMIFMLYGQILYGKFPRKSTCAAGNLGTHNNSGRTNVAFY
jgi:hypothetical protein